MAISEFQLALIGAGAVLVAGVWGYNSWQDYRQRKAAGQMFNPGQHDVLIDPAADTEDVDDAVGSGERQEPAAGEHASASSSATSSAQRIEPVINPIGHEDVATRPEPQFTVDNGDDSFSAEAFDEVTPAFVAAPDSPVFEPGEEVLDPMVEFGLAMPPDVNVSSLQGAWPQSFRFGKRIRWVARDADSGEWAEVPVDAAGRAGATKHAHVAIQLADRQGAIEKSELGTFCEAAETAAAAQGALIEVPAIDDVFAHARALDDICAAVDIQIAIHLVGSNGESFAGSKLRGLLEAAGVRPAADGVFYFHDDKGVPIFSVCQSGTQPFDIEQMRTGAIADITLWLDVPRVANGKAAFDTMLAIARRLAPPLGAMLVDDRRNPLSDAAITSIRAKVVELQTQMAAHGLPAGGRRALRLFV